MEKDWKKYWRKRKLGEILQQNSPKNLFCKNPNEMKILKSLGKTLH